MVFFPMAMVIDCMAIGRINYLHALIARTKVILQQFDYILEPKFDYLWQQTNYEYDEVACLSNIYATTQKL